MGQNRVCTLDPLVDPRWPEFVEKHPNASVFHSRAWLRALQRTYGYEPVAFTTSEPAEKLRSVLVFCGVRSWLTGNRLVSLPFSDHCELLIESPEELNELLFFIEGLRKQQGWKYVELRPVNRGWPLRGAFHEAESYCLHRLNLCPSLDVLLHSFHKDSVQRRIRKAEREGVDYEQGRSELLLQKLHRLVALSRRRHGVPPQPLEWFRNLVDCLGEGAWIRIASKEGRPVAGIMTLHQGKKVVYKYGGSDAAMNHLGGMALLFWKTIQEAKQAGAEEFDLGRSDSDNPGLIAFKEHWAAQPSMLTYWRCSAAVETVGYNDWKTQFARKVLRRLPGGVLTPIGKLLYRHMG